MTALADVIKIGPFLGIDWGKKRIGIAVSDRENRIALPLCTEKRLSIYVTLRRLWDEHAARALILGWPVHMDGTESSSCAKVRAFAEKLSPEWPLCFWDERLTTRTLTALAPFGLPAQHTDAHAAAVMLQGALDRWRQLV